MNKKAQIKNVIDILFDEDNEENIVLYNEKDEGIEFEQIAIIPYEQVNYAILKPVTPIEGIGEDEAILFEIIEDDVDSRLIVVTDDELINKVFEVYYNLFNEGGDK